jgi:hypothetical protein
VGHATLLRGLHAIHRALSSIDLADLAARAVTDATDRARGRV